MRAADPERPIPSWILCRYLKFVPSRSRSTYASRRVYASIVIWRGERQLDFPVMRFLSAFRNIKTRLLALVAIIIVPVALITILLAAAINQASSSGIESEWRRSTGEYAVRTRIWTKGAARTLSATAASVANLHDESRCG